mmetsp:Transcript_18148/g.39071  ORF Transcript_18148/g.39071 Transcript_18148/m.39071 type:complete len:297 (+) Transcript_18148:1644-2534(+)
MRDRRHGRMKDSVDTSTGLSPPSPTSICDRSTSRNSIQLGGQSGDAAIQCWFGAVFWEEKIPQQKSNAILQGVFLSVISWWAVVLRILLARSALHALTTKCLTARLGTYPVFADMAPRTRLFFTSIRYDPAPRVRKPTPTPKPSMAPRAAHASIQAMPSRSQWIHPRNDFLGCFPDRAEEEEECPGPLLPPPAAPLPEGDDDGCPCCADAPASGAPPPIDLRTFWRCFMASLSLINDSLKEEICSGSMSRPTGLMNGQSDVFLSTRRRWGREERSSGRIRRRARLRSGGRLTVSHE